MRQILIFVIAIVVIAAGSRPAHAIGPSFPCAKAVGRPIGELICESPDLSELDLQFAQAYYAARFQIPDSGQQALAVQAINFERKVEADCQIPTSDPAPPLTLALEGCISREYQGQREAWMASLTGPALEEANLPVEELVAAQADLKALGFLPADATIDGVYGSETRNAIIDWQGARGEKIDGFISNDDVSELVAQANVDALSRFVHWYAYAPYSNICSDDVLANPIRLEMILINQQTPYTIQLQNLPDGSAGVMKIVYPWLGDPNHSDYYFATEALCLAYRSHLMQLGLEPIPH